MKNKTDNRPRFGWCGDLDSEPQVIRECRKGKAAKFNFKIPVAVIPLPFMSAKLRKEIRDFAKRLNP